MLFPSAARRGARLLPEPAQLFLKRAGAVLRQDDWAASIKRLRAREHDVIDAITRQNQTRAGRKRVLIFSLQQAPPWLDVEFALAAALELRGHVVHGILCDGVLPICEMSLGRADRPPCGVCIGWLARYEDAFGFEFARLTGFLGQDDRNAAEQIVATTPDAELAALTVDGVGVGRLARRELQRYHRGFVFEPAGHPAFRPWLVSAILLVRLARRLLDRERPNIVLAASGRTLPAACLSEIAAARGIRVVTWDTEPSHPDGLVFSHGHPAVELPLDDAWPDASRTQLTEAQRRTLHQFMDEWARSRIALVPSDPAPIDDRASIRSRLELRSGAPLVVAFTNSAWDMAAVDRDVGFESMFDWIFALVDHAIGHPAVDFVVRAHPAETNAAPDLQSQTPVGAEIVKRYGPLPHNIKLVEGPGAINSYVLADIATVVTVYSSRMGLEVAMRGKRPWLAGATTYRGKGFTRDLSSKKEMLDLLAGGSFDGPLSADEINLAERFAHLWFFRYVTRLPLLRAAGLPFALTTFRDLAPGGHPVVDRLCEALVAGQPFLDLSLPG